MSVLDMFASALGAFIMCAIILYPYYHETKEFEKNIEKTREAIKKSEEDLQAAKQRVRVDEDTQKQLQQQLRAIQTSTAELDQCRRDATACTAALRDTFLLISIEWAERCDVDLYVKDLQNNHEYSYAQKRFDGSDAELSLDMRDGPGIEIWQVPVAKPGRYEVSYNPLGGKSGKVTVRGLEIDRSGRHQLPVKLLQCGGDKTGIATIEVGASGIVTRQLAVGN